MRRTLSNLLNIRETEWAPFLILYTTFFILVTGMVWGASIVEGAFLEQLGIAALPWFFIIKAGISMPAVALYAAFADRTSNTLLLAAILGIGMVGILGGIVLLVVGYETIAYALLFMLIFVPFSDIFFAHWFTYINDFFDNRAVKRIVHVLGTASIFGFVIAGVTIPLLTRSFLPQTIVGIWLMMLTIALILILVTPRLLKRYQTPATTAAVVSPMAHHTNTAKTTQPNKQQPSYLTNMFEGYHYVVQSSLLRWMVAFAVLIMLAITLLEYQTGIYLIEELQTTQNIAAFIGTVVSVSNFLMLPVQLFLLSRLVGRIGVGNANIIYPAGTVAIVGSFLLFPTHITTAFAYFGRTIFYGSIGNPMTNLLYNAVPMHVKGRVRAFIGGLMLPVGSLVGGIILLFVPIVPVTWFVPAFLVITVATCLFVAIVLRKKYTQELLGLLEQDDLSFLLSQDTTFGITDAATLQGLYKKLDESTSDEMTIFIANIISQVAPEAIPQLGEKARHITSPLVRSAMLDIVNIADILTDDVRTMFIDFLNDPHPRVRESALAGLERFYGAGDAQYLTIALTMLHDDDSGVQVQALTSLLLAKNSAHHVATQRALDSLLTSDNPHQRASATYVMGTALQYNQHYLHQLLSLHTDPSDEVRLAVALACEQLVQGTVTIALATSIQQQLLDAMNVLVHDPVERIRIASLTLLGAYGNARTWDVLVQALHDPSKQVRLHVANICVMAGINDYNHHTKPPATSSTSVETVETLGHTVLTQLPHYLTNHNLSYVTIAATVLCRINRDHYDTAITTAINETLLSIYHTIAHIEALHIIEHQKSIALVQSALHERMSCLKDDIFELLSAINNPNSVSLVRDALMSNDAEKRDNAVEALEGMTSPRLVWLIAPLFDPHAERTIMIELSKEMWHLEQPTTMQTIEALVTEPHMPLLRALMLFALGDIGMTMQQQAQHTLPTTCTVLPEGNGTNNKETHQHTIDQVIDAHTTETITQKPRRRSRNRADVWGAINNTQDSDTSDTTHTHDADKHMAPLQPSDFTQTYVISYRQIEHIITQALHDSHDDVRQVALAAHRKLQQQGIEERVGSTVSDTVYREERHMLPIIERIIFLKGIPFFQNMTVEQLKVLASVCEEITFPKDTRLFAQGDAGGTLYVIVSGKVAIEQEKRKAQFARLATIEAHSYFGEESFFDNSPHTNTALAIHDTLVLLLRREPLIALARQHPDLSLELINVLSQRLRDANTRIVELTRSRPRELHKLFDQFE